MLVINFLKSHAKGTGTYWGILETCPWTGVHSNRNIYTERRILNLLIFPREDSDNTLLPVGILNTNILYLKLINNNKDIPTVYIYIYPYIYYTL